MRECNVSLFSKFESKMDRAVENAAGSMFRSPISPVQITKRAEKEMHREKLVSAGRQYAPTLYNVLVNPADDSKLAGFYPTLAGEVETYLKGKAQASGLFMDGKPLVRFIVDEGLKSGKFHVVAENVAAKIISQLRQEEMQRYGIGQAEPVAYDQPYAQPYAEFEAEQDQYYVEEYEDASDEFLRVPQTETFTEQTSALYNIETGETFELRGSRVSVGRDRSNTICIPDANMSRNHAEFVRNGNIWILRDLGSTNGSFVGGRTISQAELYDGDVITVGTTKLEYREG
ncbi:MAG: DUF3662 domain-containing protein [Actinobacteria bacterium]|nr:DUF3662 domain-containing protein [Actinomycetota bacterium]